MLTLTYIPIAFSRRRSEHTDQNVELKPTVIFRTTPTQLEIIITWCYCKPYYIKFPPCKVSNPTYMIVLHASLCSPSSCTVPLDSTRTCHARALKLMTHQPKDCFTLFSKTTEIQPVIFNGKISTIIIFKPSKFNVNLWMFVFCVV